MQSLVVVVDVVFHVIVLLPLRLPFHSKAFCHLFVFTSCDFMSCLPVVVLSPTQRLVIHMVLLHPLSSPWISLCIFFFFFSDCRFISLLHFLLPSLPSLFRFPPQFPSFITISFCTSFSFLGCFLSSFSFQLKAGTIDRSSHQTNKYWSPEQMGWTNTGRCC